jgi:hypothetical protein
VRCFHWKTQRLADFLRDTLTAKEPPGAIQMNVADGMGWIGLVSELVDARRPTHGRRPGRVLLEISAGWRLNETIIRQDINNLHPGPS